MCCDVLTSWFDDTIAAHLSAVIISNIQLTNSSLFTSGIISQPSSSPSKSPSSSPVVSLASPQPTAHRTQSPSTDSLTSPSESDRVNEIKATVKIIITSSDACTSEEDLRNLVESMITFCTTFEGTCDLNVDYKCEEPTSGRKLVRNKRELSDDQYITTADLFVNVTTTCASPCTEDEAQASLEDVKSTIEDNIALIADDDITIGLDEIYSQLAIDFGRYYPKSWIEGSLPNEYCSNDGEYEDWSKFKMRTLSLSCH